MFTVDIWYTQLNMRANMTYPINTMWLPSTKRVWRYDCTPKKKLPKGHSQQVWLEDLGYNFIIPPSQDTLQIFCCWRWFSQVRGGKSEYLFLGDTRGFQDVFFQTSYGSVKNRLFGSNYPDFFSIDFSGCCQRLVDSNKITPCLLKKYIPTNHLSQKSPG